MCIKQPPDQQDTPFVQRYIDRSLLKREKKGALVDVGDDLKGDHI